MDRETISVIIPAFNSGEFIADALESALGQSAPAAQIIVVNDGSTDDTAARLLAFRDRITVIDQANQGPAAARNAGLRIATGDFIAFLDADDVWHPRKLEMQLAALRRFPGLQMIGTQRYDYPCAGEPAIAAGAGIEEVPRDRLLVRNYFTASSIMVRGEIIRRLGGFDTSICNVEDFDLWLRVAELGPVANLKSPLTGYRHVAGSAGRQAVGVDRGLRRVLRKLDERDSWRGRSWLRRRAISHLHFAITHLHADAGRERSAFWRLVQSMAWYPFPYFKHETGGALGRPRRAVILLLRILGLKRAEPPLATEGISR
jgi:glycosyltransferase involved in cell wall biosynthesis